MTLTDLTGTTAAEPSVVFAGKLDDDVEQGINNDTTLDDTTRKQLTEARRGQGVFRRRVLDVEPVCRVTGIENPNLLRASHVKPWRACESAQERLDGHNGLMLAPHADFLFDRGLIGSEEDGHLMFSSRLAELDAVKLGLYHVQRPPPRRLSRQSAHYFHHHRAKVYLC
jgi:predicted restriction endonuclease